MLKHLKIYPFILGLIVGIIGILCINPEKNITYKYPTPENSDKLIYKDNNGICYRYKATEVNCDKNESKLKPFPLSK